MTKKELISLVSGRSGLTEDQAKSAVDALFGGKEKGIIEETLRKNREESIQIMGFGTFKANHRPARTGTKPGTGEPMEIPARTVAKFVPGKALKTLHA